MSSQRPKIFAHRGGRKWAPENTLAAFRQSLAAGVDGIELDVRRCKTGELVIIHYDSLATTTDGTGLVQDITFADLRKLSAGKWFAPGFAAEVVPTLDEVLKLVGGKCILNIEVKNAPNAYPGIDDDLINTLATYQHQDKLVVSSFDHQLIKDLHAKVPTLAVAFLINGQVVGMANYASTLGTTYWHPDFSNLRADAVAAAQAAGLKVNVWTVNSIDEWSRAIDFGVDGIVTDDPAGLKTFLDQDPRTKI